MVQGKMFPMRNEVLKEKLAETETPQADEKPEELKTKPAKK